jgi:hypothetical protein
MDTQSPKHPNIVYGDALSVPDPAWYSHAVSGTGQHWLVLTSG